MDHEYPIEQFARGTNTRFQLGFARMTMHLLPDFDEALVEASNDGLRILGRSETALALPSELIRHIHAEHVEVDAPRVRLLDGNPIQEPVMWVRAVVRRQYAEEVIQDLVKRDADIDEVDWMAFLPVIRAKARLRHLLGYARELAVLTHDTAQVQMWLSHYEPFEPNPEHAA